MPPANIPMYQLLNSRLEKEEFDDTEEHLDLTGFLKKNGYDLDELWSEGYNIYYGYVNGVIFQRQINLSLPS